MGGLYGKITMRQFSLIDFPADLEGKKFVGPGRKFSPAFSLLLFSFHSQTEENSVFHLIFLLIFSIILKFHPTKHSVEGCNTPTLQIVAPN